MKRILDLGPRQENGDEGLPFIPVSMVLRSMFALRTAETAGVGARRTAAPEEEREASRHTIFHENQRITTGASCDRGDLLTNTRRAW